ncbi:MAG TPA: NAD(P)-dependent oxidoreductase [Flavobacteriales bacterium]
MNIAFIDSVHPVLMQRLTAVGHRCIDHSGSDRARLMEALADVHGIVVRGRIMLDAELLQRAPALRFIARAGAGMENIDKAYCTAHGIKLINSPEGNRTAVAEHALGMLLGLMNHLRRADAEVRAGLWKRKENTGFELDGRTVGLIGFGRMGSAFADKLRGFAVRILAHDKYITGFGNERIIEAPLEQVLAESDVISLHLPLTEETVHFADAAFFARLGKPVWFLNTARGPLVDTSALLDALDAGRVRGAGLDVLEFEERSLLGLRSGNEATLQRLFAEPRVLLSPHIAGLTEESYFKLADVLGDKILSEFPDA